MIKFNTLQEFNDFIKEFLKHNNLDGFIEINCEQEGVRLINKKRRERNLITFPSIMFEKYGCMNIENNIKYPNSYENSCFKYSRDTKNPFLNLIFKELSWFLRYENRDHKALELKFI